jgi:hypothetical protein
MGTMTWEERSMKLLCRLGKEAIRYKKLYVVAIIRKRMKLLKAASSSFHNYTI